VHTQAPFTQGVKANVEPKLSNPSSVMTEISPNDFTLWVKAKLKYNILIHTCLAPRFPHWRSINSKRQFPTLGANVVTIKYFWICMVPSHETLQPLYFVYIHICRIFILALSIFVFYDNKRKKELEEYNKLKNWFQLIGLSNFRQEILHLLKIIIQYFIINLRPNNRPKLFKISPYCPQDFLLWKI